MRPDSFWKQPAATNQNNLRLRLCISRKPQRDSQRRRQRRLANPKHDESRLRESARELRDVTVKKRFMQRRVDEKTYEDNSDRRSSLVTDVRPCGLSFDCDSTMSGCGPSNGGS